MALRSRVRYGCLDVKDFVIPDNAMGTVKATNVTGCIANGSTAFCVKRSNDAKKSTIYRIMNFVENG